MAQLVSRNARVFRPAVGQAQARNATKGVGGNEKAGYKKYYERFIEFAKNVPKELAKLGEAVKKTKPVSAKVGANAKVKTAKVEEGLAETPNKYQGKIPRRPR